MLNLHYRQSDPADLRDLPQSLLDDWAAAGNPKLAEWLPAPAKPAEDAVWEQGAWIIPLAPTYTANEWLEKEGYGPTQLITLLDLQGKLIAAGKASQKLNSVRAWTDGILASFVQDESPRSDWGSAPFAFSETVIDAFQQLN
jgi:hypothetical protein